MRRMEAVATRAWVMIVLASFAVPPAAATHQNDAGLGADAPNDVFSAPAIPLAPFTGSLDAAEGDDADWYLVFYPPQMGLVITLDTGAGPLEVSLAEPGGSVFSSVQACCGPQFGVDELVAPPGMAQVRIGVIAPRFEPPVTGDYSVYLSLEDPADLDIVGLEVSKRPVATDAGPAPLSTQATVTVTVRNAGPGVSLRGRVDVWVEHSIGSARSLNGADVPRLAPGQEFAVLLNWDGTGEVGDVRIHAGVGHPLEADWSNNDATASSWVLVGNVGAGADAGNMPVRFCDPQLCAGATTVYGEEFRRGAFYDWSAPVVPTWGGGHVGTHPNQVHQPLGAWVGNTSITLYWSVTNGSPDASVCHDFQDDEAPPECAEAGGGYGG